jgi:hypothetical protein
VARRKAKVAGGERKAASRFRLRWPVLADVLRSVEAVEVKTDAAEQRRGRPALVGDKLKPS